MQNSKKPPKWAWAEVSDTLDQEIPNSLVAAITSTCVMAQPHWHAQVEVNFVFRGGVRYQMSTHVVDLSVGDLCLFWGGLPHQAVQTRDNTEFVAIHLPLVHFFRMRLPAEVSQRLIRGATVVASSTGADDPEAFRRLSSYMASDDAARREYAIEELILRLKRLNFEPFQVLGGEEDGTRPPPTLEPSALRNIVNICDYVAKNFRSDIDATDVAVFADIHPKYAMTIFRKSTGLTLNEYITLLRLSYAQALLLGEPVSILDVAMESGFGSLSAFSQAFRKITGQSPTDFRRASTARA